MKLSRKADYAIRAIRHIASLPKGETASINAIAASERIPREFLAKILRALTSAGVLASYKGVTGGYRLARLKGTVSYLSIIEAVDGTVHINLCTEPGKCSCAHVGDRHMHAFWHAQERALKRALAKRRFV